MIGTTLSLIIEFFMFALISNVVSMLVIIKKVKCKDMNWVVKSCYVPSMMYTVALVAVTSVIVIYDVDISIKSLNVIIMCLFALAMTMLEISSGVLRVASAKRRDKLVKTREKIKEKIKNCKDDNEKLELTVMLDNIKEAEKRVILTRTMLNNIISAEL